jgi:hypothetical protein
MFEIHPKNIKNTYRLINPTAVGAKIFIQILLGIGIGERFPPQQTHFGSKQ